MNLIRLASSLLVFILLTSFEAKAQTVFFDASNAINARKANSLKLEGNATTTIEMHTKDPNIVLVLIVQLNPKALGEKSLTVIVAEGVSQTFDQLTVKDELFPGRKVWFGAGGPKDKPHFQDQAKFFNWNGEIRGEFNIGKRAFMLLPIGGGRAVLSEFGEKLKQPAPHSFLKSRQLPNGGSLYVSELIENSGKPSTPIFSTLAAPPEALHKLAPIPNAGMLPTYQELSEIDQINAQGERLMENFGSIQVAAPQPRAALPVAPTAEYPGGINILFAATPNSLGFKNNSTQFISDLVGEMNQIMTNNNLTVRFNLVGVEMFPDYNSVGLAYQKVESSFDITRARNRVNADLIVVFGVFAEGCMGLAEVLPSAKSAYTVISARCQNLARSTVHEIGHLMGGRHNAERDGQMTPYTKGHGYVAKSHYFPTANGGPAIECTRTVMADQPLASGCARDAWTERWSNPSYKIGDLHKQLPPNGWWGPYQSVYLGDTRAANMAAVLELTLPRTRSLRLEKLPESSFEAILMVVLGLFD